MGRYRYCHHCGTATTPRMIEGRERDYCEPCRRPLYDNAKPTVGVLVTDEAGRILLLKRAIQPYFGCWDIPGGFLEADEHPEAGALREVLEETGLEIALEAVLGHGLDHYQAGPDPAHAHYSLVVYYRARPVGGTLAVNAESSEAGWFAPEALPEPEAIAFESARELLGRLRRNP
ncbi:MAG: NUDIX hydrolase [Candidatus Sericytochromatia bacterium]